MRCGSSSDVDDLLTSPSVTSSFSSTRFLGVRGNQQQGVRLKKRIAMSVYHVNKLLYLTDNDPEFRKRMLAHPEAVLGEFRLTSEERDALTSGAVGKLYRMGVHTFLLNHLYRYQLFGVNRDNYLERIREGMPYDPRFELGNMPVQRFITKQD